MAIDGWGKFAWLLVRCCDQHSGRQKLLLRGKNGCDHRQAHSNLEQQVARMAQQHGLPTVRLELLGEGWMEWQRDKERLNIVGTRLHSAATRDMRLQRVADLEGMVAKLSRSSLAGSFRILANGVEVQ